MILSCFSCRRDVVASGATHHCCSCCCSFFPFELWFTLELVSKPIPNCKCVITNCKPLTICTEHIDFATKCFSQRRRWATFEIWYNWENNKAVHSTESTEYTHPDAHTYVYIKQNHKIYLTAIEFAVDPHMARMPSNMRARMRNSFAFSTSKTLRICYLPSTLWSREKERERENNKKPNISPIWVAQ